MKTKKKHPAVPFAKGNKYGKGRPPLTDHEKACRKMTAGQVVDLISRFGGMTQEELVTYAKNPQISMFELSFCKMWADIVKNGDHQKFEFLLGRAVGKVPDRIRVSYDPYEGMTLEQMANMKKHLELENQTTLRMLESARPVNQHDEKNENPLGDESPVIAIRANRVREGAE